MDRQCHVAFGAEDRQFHGPVLQRNGKSFGLNRLVHRIDQAHDICGQHQRQPKWQ
jgi:hypothetical protein